MNRAQRTLSGALLPLLGFFSITAPAFAQNAQPPQPARVIEEGLRRETQRLLERPREVVRDALRPSEVNAQASSIPQEKPCFDIRRIEWSGPSAE